MFFRGISLRDLALRIGHHLREHGIDAVLTGGACVSIHTGNRYLSYDLDFVLMAAEDRKAGGRALAELGFLREGRHFRHSDTPFLVEFLLPPLSIGAEPVRHPSEIRRGRMILKLLSPTDCVKDRLAAFYFWNDHQSLDQALLVAGRHPVDFRDIRRWSVTEGMLKKYLAFLRLWENAQRSPPAYGGPTMPAQKPGDDRYARPQNTRASAIRPSKTPGVKDR